MSAGFEYGGERFDRNFADFKDRYGITDMYTGGFYPFETSEEKWAFWSRMVYTNRFADEHSKLYSELLALMKDRNYFVITTNVDHWFQKAGFDKERLYYTQGDYGLFQCSLPCCNRTFDNESQIRGMVAQQSDMRIPSSLVPRCPRCGREMRMNLRCDDTFVEDLGWTRAKGRYDDFLFENRHSKVLFLELGVGFNTPGIIKYPFWQMTYANSDATYVSVNNGPSPIPNEIKDRSILISRDISEVIGELLDSEQQESKIRGPCEVRCRSTRTPDTWSCRCSYPCRDGRARPCGAQRPSPCTPV